ncbi:MAG: AraC family transcriptional regulator [Pseudomonadota bacterium]
MFWRRDYMAPSDGYHIARKPLSRGILHAHDYHEVFVVEAGTCRHQVNGTEDRLEAGAFVFVRPGDVHALEAWGGAVCRIVNVIVLEETVVHLSARYPELRGVFDRASGMPPVLNLGPLGRERAMRLLLPLQTGLRRLARVEAALLSLLVEEVDLPGEVALPAWLARACEAARAPEVYRAGAAGFVAAAGRGHAHVCRATQRHLGVTPSAYVNRVRLDRAAALLSEGERSLPEIVETIGLENLSHFHRLFRARFGVTPSVWRRMHGGTPF